MERMWKRWRGEIFRAFLAATDVVALAGSFVTAYWLRYRAPGMGAVGAGPGIAYYWPAVVGACVVWVSVLSYFGLYQLRRGWRLSDLVLTSVYAVSVATVAFLGLSYMLHMISYSRLLILYLWMVNITSVAAVRLLAKQVLRKLSQAEVGVRRLAVVGDNGSARRLIKTIALHPELGYRLVGLLRPERPRAATEPGPFLRTVDVAARFAASKIDDVIIALPVSRSEELRDLICRCQEKGMKVRILPDIYEAYSAHMACEPIENIPLFVPRHQSLAAWELGAKRVFDLAISALLFAPALIVWLALAARQWFFGGDRILVKESRVGRDGVPFAILRFGIPLDETGSPTRFGRLMSIYSLSELPQLWNVIKGEMSVVGPRPESPERVERYNLWHRRRLMVKPGITGLAQVNGLRGFSTTDEKMRFDLEYIEGQSPMLDLRILLQTIWTLLRRPRQPVDEPRPCPDVYAEPVVQAEVSEASASSGALGRC